MTTLLSSTHALNNIRLHWEVAGFDALPTLLAESVASELGRDVYETRLGALYVFVDEFIGVLRYTSYYFLFGVAEHPRSALLFYRLAVKQVRTLAAIRMLCGSGLDANARMQLRLLHETSLVWVRSVVDQDFQDEFAQAGDPEAANRFWHKELSKGKNEKWLRAHLPARGIKWFGDDKPTIESMQRNLSLSAHPTSLLAAFDAQNDWRDPSDALVLNRPSDASHFTLSMALYVTAMPFLMMPSPTYGMGGAGLTRNWHPKHRSASDWETYNAKMREMFARLYLASTRFSDELAKPQEARQKSDSANS